MQINAVHRLAVASLLAFSPLLAQTRVGPQTRATPPPAIAVQEATPAPSSQTPAAVNAPSDYTLGGGDQLQIDIPDLSEEFTSDKTFRIDGSGDLGLPLAGHVQAGGLTVKQLEEVLKSNLKRLLKQPDITVILMGFGSQPVSVLGSVTTPGIVQIAGHKNLFEVLSLAGGLAPDAGYEVTITREIKWGPIPLSDAHLDSSGQYSIATVRIKDLLNSSNTAEDIIILPNDKISVPTSELVYAVGDVIKPGGFLLNQHESLSALQVVSLAEGLGKAAAADRAKILRVVPGSPNRAEITINLTQLMAGKTTDFQLQPQDILFVPNSRAKSAGFRALDALVAASGAAVYTATRF